MSTLEVQGREIICGRYLASQDFQELIALCLPFPDGKLWHRDAIGNHYLIHPSHLVKASHILQRYGMRIEVQEKTSAEATGKPGPKNKNKVGEIRISFVRKVVDMELGSSHQQVPFDNIDAVYREIRETKSILPRPLWFRLTQSHKLYPDVDKIDKAIWHDPELSHDEKNRLSWFLSHLMTSAFEGRRRTKDNTDNLSYYQIYWHPALILRKLSLIDQVPPNRELFLLPKGEETSDWKTVAQSVLPSWENEV